jgi:predicted metal-dependent phosphoesterase TrpH
MDAFGRADLHMHTTASDGLMTVRALLDGIARRGNLDVIAITDHTLDAGLWAVNGADYR